MAGGVQSRQNQIPYPPGEWPTNWRTTTIPKKFSHCCEGSEPHARLPSLGIQQRDWVSPGIWPWRPASLIIELPQDEGKQISFLEGGHKQNLSHTKTQRKGRATPQETEPKLPASAGGSAVEAWVGRGSPQGRGTGSSSLGRSPLA